MRIRVTDYARAHALKHPAHPSQTAEMVGGDCVLSFTIYGTVGILLWARRFLPHIEIQEPQWLRDQFIDELKAPMKLHTT